MLPLDRTPFGLSLWIIIHLYDPSLFLFFSWVCQCNVVCFYSVHNENILRRSICFQHHACFSIAIELAEIWFVLKIPPITGSSGWFWGEMKRWVAKAKVILWFWRKTKGIKEPLAFVERIADIYRNVKFDRVVLTFVSKILGRFSSAPKLYCSWKLWAKVNYKQLHLATKSIWGFNPILEQIAWKCKIDCLLELEGEEGEGRDIKL